mmetsp:Transcript_7001/g.12923  ORF Transcript_7001/g.12923 Transcript_7001/m.12923 type:complete len:250 (-) Transcript_7001:364-1113(-)
MVAPRRTTYAASLALNAALAAVMLYVTFSSQSSGNQEDLGIALSQSSLTRDVTMHARKNQIKSGRRCGLTGKEGTTAYKYCFSHKRATKRQQPNLQRKFVYWPEGQRMVKLKLSTDALKTIDKLGLEAMAKKAGIDLNKLPFKDLRPERKEYLNKHKMEVPVSKKTVTGFYRKTYRMKNPEKLAASKKTPIQGKYYHGTVVFGRFTEDELRQLNDVPLEKDLVKTYEDGVDVEDISAGGADEASAPQTS